MSSTLDQLLEMGCNPIISEAAIKHLKTQDLSTLLDWISDHSEEQQKWSKWLQEQGQQSQGQGQGQGQTISHLVKKEFVETLMAKGFSKNVAEKSLLLTGNTSVESADNWINEHRYDADFEEELQLQGNAFQESTLTDEQAKQKLKELTEKARQAKKKREEEDERQREKNRMKFGKEMVEAKRIAEEQAMKRQVQLDKIQKKRDEDYKAQLLEQMRRQKQERLGIKIPATSNSATVTTKVEPKLSKLEQVEIQCQQVTVGMHAYPDRARTFFETANIYVNNIIKSNGQQKTRKINQSNKAFQERIAGCFGGVETLEVIGFHEDNGFLVMNSFDLGELGRISGILQKYIAMY